MKDLNFKRKKVFPDAEGAFFFKLKSVEDIKNECLVVIDTNALIVPFVSGNKSIEAIKKLYKMLSDEDRLFIPVHVVREFLDIRASKLSSLNHALLDKSSQNIKTLDSHPLLDQIPEFDEVKRCEYEVLEALKKYRKSISNTLEVIKSWGWNDPVSKIYHEVLSGRVLKEPEFNEEDVVREAERRDMLKIPPGYKDSSKEENKVGDLLIWNEVLELGKNQKKHLVFVTHEEKQDWWHKSSGAPLYPRMELVDEYRRVSEGKSFHIKSLSEVLSVFGADTDAVQEIRDSENERTEMFKWSEVFTNKLTEKDFEGSSAKEILDYMESRENSSVNVIDHFMGKEDEDYFGEKSFYGPILHAIKNSNVALSVGDLSNITGFNLRIIEKAVNYYLTKGLIYGGIDRDGTERFFGL